MAQIYFSKFNINSEIYAIYKDDKLKEKILDDILEKIDTETIIEESVEDKGNKGIEEIQESEENEDKIYRYKFCNLEKNYDNRTVTGRLVKIFKGEVQSYDEEKDTINIEEKDDCASSCTFHFDLKREQIAFITRRDFGYKQFNKYFKELVETYFENISFEIFLENNIDDLKEKIYSFSKLLSVEIVIIPPNASTNDFDTLFGTSKKDVEESNATKYTQRLDVSTKSPNGINARTNFFDRMFFGIAKGYGQITAKGKNNFNQLMTVTSDEDAPYKRPILDVEKDSIIAFKEKANDYIIELVSQKMELKLDENKPNQGAEE